MYTCSLFIYSNTTLHYSTGVSVGMLASALILFYMMTRILPQVSLKHSTSLLLTFIILLNTTTDSYAKPESVTIVSTVSMDAPFTFESSMFLFCHSFMVFFSVRLLSVLHGYFVFSFLPQRPMTSDFEEFSSPDS